MINSMAFRSKFERINGFGFRVNGSHEIILICIIIETFNKFIEINDCILEYEFIFKFSIILK